MDITRIPSAVEAPPDGRPSPLVRRVRAAAPARRTVFKGVLTGLVLAALAPLDWAYTRARAWAAGPTSEHPDCDGFAGPMGYEEDPSNWWSGAAVCMGGWRRGTYPCSGGFHFEGSRSSRGENYQAYRVGTSCGGRNAWRWVTAGKEYRCSDAHTEVTWEDGDRYEDLTIAVCEL
ncbi:hypothetical protein ACQEU5_03145 [Marinactinospora thermotolerans]|uniref:Uncharacterized protein n=1 Tax=Marinactinospora thermotolerans DSM 45154 TaxID=1122192 RepID=A0A1T4LHB6_9ACTN|nr:hypothetical protein [Marinactinospora thermotolerans]SJZ54189.1 hypothetical protein SAMN02745673_00680 [Marinactinospora thermotolerans DSM 45154]